MVHSIREVRVGIPLERLAELRSFYIELIGLLPWPPAAQVPGGLGLGHPRRGLYLEYRHDPHIDPMRRRCTLIVPSLRELIKRLDPRRHQFTHHHGLTGVDEWLLLTDPVGHILEIREAFRLV